tara:strand:+ start:13288 stop:15072 length:1785 start_codon:yes stop_codon:yes gene_type:complete
MEKVTIELEANSKEAEKQINKVNESLKKVSSSAKNVSKELSGTEQVGNEGIKALDKNTGGLATKFVAVGKAAKLSGKAMKTALISSGIGLVVALLATMVEYWDDIVKLVDGVSSEQENLLLSTESTLKAQQNQLSITNSMENTLKLQGKSEKEIRDLKKQQTDEIIISTQLLLEQQIETKRTQIEAAERNKKIATGIIAFLSMPITILLGAVDALTAGLTKIGVLSEATTLAEDYLDFTSSLIFDPEETEREGDKTIEETKRQLEKLKNTRDGYVLQDKADSKAASDNEIRTEEEEARKKAEALESIRKTLIDTEAEERAEKLRLIKEDYAEQIRLAELYYGEDTEKVKELKAAKRLALEEQQAEWDEIDLEKKKNAEEEEAANKLLADEAEAKRIQDKLDAEQDAADKKVAMQNKVLDDLMIIGGAETKFGKAMLIAKQLLAAKEMILSIKSTIAEAKAAALKANAKNAAAGVDIAAGSAKAVSAFAPPANIPIIIGYAAQAVGIVSSIRNAMKAMKSATKGVGPTSPDIRVPLAPTVSVPPDFNVVGASETSQLAGAIGNDVQQPIQAFVVSNDVTSSQELDRNIVDGASIG